MAAYSATGKTEPPEPAEVVALLRGEPAAAVSETEAITLARLADAEPSIAIETARYVTTRGKFSYYVGTDITGDRVCMILTNEDGSAASSCADTDRLLSNGLSLSLVASIDQTLAVLVGDSFVSVPEIVALGEPHENLIIVDDLPADVTVQTNGEDGALLTLVVRVLGPVPQGYDVDLNARVVDSLDQFRYAVSAEAQRQGMTLGEYVASYGYDLNALDAFAEQLKAENSDLTMRQLLESLPDMLASDADRP